MGSDDSVSIEALPRPLSWLGRPDAWSADDGSLTIRGGAGPTGSSTRDRGR